MRLIYNYNHSILYSMTTFKQIKIFIMREQWSDIVDGAMYVGQILQNVISPWVWPLHY